MPRRGALPRCQDDLVTPPASTPDEWSAGALSVSNFCSTFNVGRDLAFELMRDGTLVWARLGRERRISRRSARALFASAAADDGPTP